MPVADILIVGGGIVGLATALAWLAARPGSHLILLEKEPVLGAHQTGHNSGVIHSGVYYPPGSLKAATCVAGAALLVEFCRVHGIPHRLCGKLIVAAEPAELPALERLYERGRANGVEGLALIGPERMRELEPHARGVRALHVPSTGIVDYAAVVRTMAGLIRRQGGEIRTGTRVTRSVRRASGWAVQSETGECRTRMLVTCGGLHADRLTRMAGGPTDVQVAPFRGEYYEVVPERRDVVHALLYPVPDPALPFLGVHFIRTVDGGLHAGPNAVLALAREGYRKADINLRDTLELLRFAGFWRMAWRYWRAGLAECSRSWSKRAFVRALQRLVPDISAADLVPGASGVRAQALSERGALLDDFEIVAGEATVHVRNVPSPAATASLRIGQRIAEMALDARNKIR